MADTLPMRLHAPGAQRAMRGLYAGLYAGLFVCVPQLLHAQQTTGTTSRVRIVSGGASAIASRCAELTSSPTMLTRAPEGRALLRFKRELDDAAVVIEQRGDTNRQLDIKRISQVQRGVDSLMQVVVRFARDGAAEGPTMLLRRGDSVRVTVDGRPLDPRVFFESIDAERRAMLPQVELELRGMAPTLQAGIRSLQPQIAAFAEMVRGGSPMRTPAPSGWLGMHLSESKITIMSPDGPLTNYCDYPVIEAVDAGSPVEKAGLIAGDTVLAYNGRDVRTQVVNYSELLVAGQQLRMRVKRGSRSRDYSVTVANRPPLERSVTIVRSACAAGTTCESSNQFSFSAMPSPPPTPPTPLPPTGMLFPSTGIAVIAGAQLSVVDEDFAQSLGVEPGLLVMRAPPSTPAADAGLRAGDVIRAVNGAPVRDFTLIRRAFSANSAREVKLTVSARGAAPRIVTVRW